MRPPSALQADGVLRDQRRRYFQLPVHLYRCNDALPGEHSTIIDPHQVLIAAHLCRQSAGAGRAAGKAAALFLRR